MILRHSLSIALSLVGACATAPRPPESAHSSDVARERAEFARSLFTEGQMLGRQGDHVRGEQYIEAAIEHGYPRIQALTTLVRLCIDASRFRAALNYAEPALIDDPADFRLRHVVASLHLALGNHGRARTELERVTEDAPEFAAAHFLLGSLVRDAFADHDTVRTHFSRYVELDPRGTHAREAVDWLKQNPAESTGTHGADHES